ncbi:MAG: orotidine-5'-phosphate decarboxylase [Sedimentisphaerales bacterium]|nr:orotidine-5'-phosphate decarboxylase [Sedimentisphaerales bacterium]
MSDNFADRLTAAIKTKGTCAAVGIDPVYDKLPKALIERADLNDPKDLPVALDAITEFCTKTMKIVAPIVPAVKINSAFFERYLWEGTEAYYSLIQEAEALGVEVIGDVKRGDIGSTAESYAMGHLKNSDFMDMEHIVAADAITINGFAGREGIVPFADMAMSEGKGVFVWTRASNPSAGVLQDFADANGKKFWELLAEQVATIACEPKYMGQSGYSSIGMVVGGTTAQQTQVLREQYPHIIFLVPGYGAQGAGPDDCRKFCKADGTGAIVPASRSVIYAFNEPKYKETYGSDNWEKCIEQAAMDMAKELAVK